MTMMTMDSNNNSSNDNDDNANDGFQFVKKTSSSRERRKQQQQHHQNNNGTGGNNRTAHNKSKRKNTTTTTPSRGGGGGGTGRDRNSMSTSFGHGWSKPTQHQDLQKQEEGVENLKSSATSADCEIQPWKINKDIDDASERIADVVQAEVWDVIDDNDNDNDALINTSIAATAAVTFISSALGGAGGDSTSLFNDGEMAGDADENQLTEQDNTTNDGINLDRTDDRYDDKAGGDFASFAKGQSMSALMEEFGAPDPNWKTMEIPDSTSQPRDHDPHRYADAEGRTTESKTNTNNNNNVVYQKTTRSMLGTEGKAPIHVQIESFGYVHGAPSRSTRDSGWSPYTQPLAPIDIRHVIEPVPTYLMWHDGIHSAQVKRVIMSQTKSPSKSESDSHSSRSEQPKETKEAGGFVQYTKSIASEQILPCIIEAQDVGGHGYVSPLSCKIQIGSELGRHRSVVVVERVAVALRQLLRTNPGSKIHQPVSVTTFHRDIEKKPPNLKSTRGENSNNPGNTNKWSADGGDDDW